MKEKQCLNEPWKLRRNTMSASYTLFLIFLLICPNNGSGSCVGPSMLTSGMSVQYSFPDCNELYLWYMTEMMSARIYVLVLLDNTYYGNRCGLFTETISYNISKTQNFNKITITYSESTRRTSISVLNLSSYTEYKSKIKYVQVWSQDPVWLARCGRERPLYFNKEISALKEKYHRKHEEYQRLLVSTIKLGVFGLLAVTIFVAACLCLQYKKTPNIRATNMGHAWRSESTYEDVGYIRPITFTTETRNQDDGNENTSEHIYESVLQANEYLSLTRENTEEDSGYNQHSTDEYSDPNHPTIIPNSLYESWTPGRQ